MMRVIHRAYLSCLTASIAMVCVVTGASAQPNAVDAELDRFKGFWRVIEMVEDGRAIPEDQMQQWLPGGGVLEIVDYTLLFKSPVDGIKSTKTYRLDPTSYPKRIAIMDRNETTGTGIYEFDGPKLVVCVSDPAAELPSDFSAPTGSKRTLIIMTRFDPGTSEIPGFNAKLPARQTLNLPSPPPEPAPAPPQFRPLPVSVPATPIVAETVAAVVLTDTQVHNMAVGSWRLNDADGSVDLVFGKNGGFQTYRYYKNLQNFHIVFVPTPCSSGTWSIVNGRLIAKVTSSTRLDRLNQAYGLSVRSISATDMILEDQLGTVSRAVKLR